MDSIRVSEAPDTGSIPVEATKPSFNMKAFYTNGSIENTSSFDCLKFLTRFNTAFPLLDPPLFVLPSIVSNVSVPIETIMPVCIQSLGVFCNKKISPGFTSEGSFRIAV